MFELAKDFVGVLGKAKNAVDQIHNLATEFDGLIPEGADIAEVRQSMTLGKFIRSKHGVKSIIKGAIAGSTVASALGSFVPGIGTGIGAAVGMVVGAIAMPLLRYYFLKKGLKLAETLHTQEIKDGLNTAVDTTNKVIDGAQSLASGGRDLIDKIKNFADSINTYPAQIQDLFYKQLGELTSENQREAMKLLNRAVSILLRQSLRCWRKHKPLLTCQARQRALVSGWHNWLTKSRPMHPSRPVPKPRKLIQKLQRRNSESTA